jgi:hypothetical protein
MQCSGVQSKNVFVVNKVENQGIYEWILTLIDIVVFVVFALYSSVPQTVCRDTLLCRQKNLLCREKSHNATNIPNIQF